MKFLQSFRDVKFLFPIFLALVCTIFLWAALFEIDTSVNMPGELRPLGQSVRVQNRFEGKVNSVLPSVGDQVSKGGTLFSLETDVDQAAIDENSIRLASVTARLARLRSQVALEADLPPLDSVPRRVLIDQAAILAASLDSLNAQLGIHNAEMQSVRAELLSLQESVPGLQEAIDVAEKKQNLVKQLYQDGYEGELSFLESRQAYIEAVRALNEHRVRIEQLKGRLQTLDGRKVGEVSRFQTEAAQALADAVDEHETLLAQRESLNARFQEYQITSPVAGTIGRLHVNNFGEVLTPGALVAEIIPDGVPIVFYGRLRESDLPDVAVGQRARVTLSFMDTRTEKPLDAAVRSIDPDVTEEEDGSRYYAVVLQFDAERADARLFVGSGGSAFLITGKRTVLSYLFEPIYDVFTRALREN